MGNENMYLGCSRRGLVEVDFFNDGREVAVKKVPKKYIPFDVETMKKEVEKHKLLDHENVLKLLHYDDSHERFRYSYLLMTLFKTSAIR